MSEPTTALVLSEPPTHVGELPALMQLAKELVPTGFLPDHIKTPGQAVAIILAGRELGIGPMLALRSIYMLKGKVELSADLQLSLFKRDGGQAVFKELTEIRAVLSFTHPNGDQHTEVFTMDDAKRAGLVRPGSNWTNYPKAMLRSRVITAGLKSIGFEPKMSGVYAPGEIGGPELVEAEMVETELEFPKTHKTTAPARSVAADVSTKPQPGEDSSPQSSPGLQSKNDQSINALLEASKSKFLRQLQQDNLLLPAWVWAIGAGIVLENEQLTAANATRLFVSADLQGSREAAIKAIAKDHETMWQAIHKTKEGLEKNDALNRQMQAQFNAVYGPLGTATAEPEQPPKANPEWFWDVIISIPRKGQKKAEYEKNPDTIGSLYNALKNGDDYARSRLFGLANDWECKPREYNGKTYPPSEGDKATRKALDAFLEWEETKAKDGCDDAREAVDDGDSPPF